MRRDAVAVPAGHDRRRDRRAGRRTRPGPGRRRPRPARRRACGRASFSSPSNVCSSHRARPRALRDRDVLARLGQHVARQVGDRDARVRGAEVGGQHDARVAVERERPRRAAAARRARLGGHDEPAREQRVDALRDRGPRQPGQRDELGMRPSAPVADEPEHRPRPIGRRACKASHLLSLPERGKRRWILTPRAGFEPAAYSLGGSRSIRLSYRGSAPCAASNLNPGATKPRPRVCYPPRQIPRGGVVWEHSCDLRTPGFAEADGVPRSTL